VSPEWVLSAAHCGSEPSFYVVAGQWKVSQVSGKEQVIKASKAIRHPLYNSNTMTHDFLMVKVEKPFTFDDCVGAVCLPSGPVAAETPCMISGWGTLSSGGSQPKTMQEAEVKTISNANCVRKTDYTDADIDDSMLCAQGQKQNGDIVDACQGDSGGPLVCESGGSYSLHGATSWGYGCAAPEYPGIWAKVSTVTSWVKDVMDGTYVPPPAPACRRRWCR
jgi:secreted trypsin-like serine protease